MNQISLGMGDMELFEAYIRMYLDEAQMLVKRGLRSAYEEKTDNLRCFRGKLQVSGHIRRNIAHKERFYVTYEEFTKNRPENRLIKTTLKKLQKVTTDGKNKQDARELLLFFDGIQESVDYRQDFAQIRIDRNSREYEKIMKWTEVILLGNSFLNFSDGSRADPYYLPWTKFLRIMWHARLKNISEKTGRYLPRIKIIICLKNHGIFS